jgi:hypothetical protein
LQKIEGKLFKTMKEAEAQIGASIALRNEGAVNSTMAMGRSKWDLPVSRRFMNAARNCRRGVRTGLESELENPNAVERSAGDQPCGRVELEGSVEQWRKGSGASIDVFQQTSVIDRGN